MASVEKKHTMKGWIEMRITIDIPKEFESDFTKDAFAECLDRLIADANLLAGNYEIELAEMLKIAFKNSVSNKEDEQCQVV